MMVYSTSGGHRLHESASCDTSERNRVACAWTGAGLAKTVTVIADMRENKTKSVLNAVDLHLIEKYFFKLIFIFPSQELEYPTE